MSDIYEVLAMNIILRYDIYLRYTRYYDSRYGSFQKLGSLSLCGLPGGV